MPDRTIDQLEIQGPTQIRRPLTAPAKIQTALDVSQKCSHIYNPLASKVIDLGVRKDRATSSPKAILPVLRLSRFSQPNKDCFTGRYGNRFRRRRLCRRNLRKCWF